MLRRPPQSARQSAVQWQAKAGFARCGLSSCCRSGTPSAERCHADSGVGSRDQLFPGLFSCGIGDAGANATFRGSLCRLASNSVRPDDGSGEKGIALFLECSGRIRTKCRQVFGLFGLWRRNQAQTRSTRSRFSAYSIQKYHVVVIPYWPIKLIPAFCIRNARRAQTRQV